MQMNIRKNTYLNRGETYEDMIDHRSYEHVKLKPETKFRPKRDSNP